MKESIAKFFSFIFHPILLPTIATVILFGLPSYLSSFQFEYKKGVTQIVFLSTFITPLFILLILVNLKVISSFYLEKKEERFFPFIIVSIIYIATYFIINNLPLGVLKISSYISNFILFSAAVIIITLLTNIKIKSSAHMAGIGTFLSYFYVFFIKEDIGDVLFSFFNFQITIIHFFSIIVLVAGIIASSRLILKAHDMIEILMGFFIGLIIGLFSVFV